MSGSKIKTMVIVALALINVVFLAVIVIGAVGDIRSERQAIENACAILRHNGIEIEPDAVRPGGALKTMRTVRMDETEAAIVNAVLGPTEMTEQGMIIFSYENAERGTAEFFSSGVFEILLNKGVITKDGETLKTVQRLLGDMKLETADTVLSVEGGNETVTVISAFKGASIFNCTIDFVFVGESLELITGRYVADTEVAEDGIEISSAGTALLWFLAEVRREEIECARVYSVEAGYQHHVAGSGGVIAPVWLVTADSGQFIIDDATGEVWGF